MFVGNLLQEAFVDIAGDHAGERRIVGERFPAEQTADGLLRNQLVCGIFRVDLLSAPS
jgi:hypothetical protein